METNDTELEYTEAVQCERRAWQALQASAPGSNARAQAWHDWAEAITRTNRAWRKLNATQLAQPWNRASRHMPVHGIKPTLQ